MKAEIVELSNGKFAVRKKTLFGYKWLQILAYSFTDKMVLRKQPSWINKFEFVCSSTLEDVCQVFDNCFPKIIKTYPIEYKHENR